MHFLYYLGYFTACGTVGIILYRRIYKKEKNKYISRKIVESLKTHNRHMNRNTHISKIIAKNKKH